jgi:hypothetical protein
MTPIETHYNGYHFRSRLEARWAVCFDALGLTYQYEPEGFDLGDAGWYLPDFCVSYQHPYFAQPYEWWIEIKPHAPTEREVNLARALAAQRGEMVAIFCGLPGAADLERCTHFLHVYPKSTPPGLTQWFPFHDALYLLQQVYGPGWSRFPGDRDQKEHTARLRGIAALTAARSARFEHGETPVCLSP